MLRVVARLALIVLVGGLVYVATANAYSPDTANVIALGYFILTLRLYDLVESVEGLVAGTTTR